MTGKAQLFSWSRTRKAECNVRSWNSRNDSSPVRIARNWIILITLSQIGLLISSHDPPRLRCPDWTCSLFFPFWSLTRSLTNPPLFLFVAFFSFSSLFFFLSIGSKPIDRDAFSMRAPSILPVIDNVFVIQLQPRAAGQREIRSARKNDWRKMPCFSRVEITSVL